MRETLLSRVCPLLERAGDTRTLSYAPAPWILKQCAESGFVFLENPPDYEAFKEEFAWEATWETESEARRQAEPVLYATSTALKQLRLRVIKRNKTLALSIPLVLDSSKRHTGPLHAIDMGCGTGDLLPMIISRLPADVRARCVPYGIELSKKLAGAASEKLAQVSANGSEGTCINDSALNGLTRFSPEFFDLIIMSSLLEHEINPLPLLRRCFERLRPGGRIVIKVPNYGCVNRVVRGRRWCGFRWPDHVNYFTPRTLKAMGRRAGLEVARMRLVDRHPFSDGMYAIFRK